MPCEACNVQFTVFKRKKSCAECRRLYCSNCLTRLRDRPLCERCVIFNKRPLSKIELLKLKAKDLIFYLQSQHISTTGCVEKEELVNLVLIHVNNNYSSDPQSSSRNQYEAADDRSNPFDQIKNTCQNLFTTFTEKIATDLNFDMKSSQNGGQQPNIFAQQPRRSSSQSRNGQPMYYAPATPMPPPPPPSTQPATHTSGQASSSSSGHSGRGSNASSASPMSPTRPTVNPQSPTTSMSSAAGAATARHPNSTNTAARVAAGGTIATDVHRDAKQNTRSDKNKCERVTPKSRLHVDLIDACGNVSGCECSDDEIITNFQRHYSRNNSVTAAGGRTDEQEAGPSGSTGSSVKTASRSPNRPSGGSDDSSDVSSFEDLGAGSATMPDVTPLIDAETWQIINRMAAGEAASPTSPMSPVSPDTAEQPVATVATSAPTVASPKATTRAPPPNIMVSDDTGTTSQIPAQSTQTTDAAAAADAFQAHSSNETDQFNPQFAALPKFKTKRQISRRRSDGLVYSSSSAVTRHNLLDDDDDATTPDGLDSDADESSAGERSSRHQRRPRKSCRKCGKTKGDIRKHIERFRKQLETTTNASEAEIKQQLEDFLNFLESRSRHSIDDGIEAGADEAHLQSDGIDSLTDGVTYGEEDDAYDEYGFDDDAGIHVYGTNDENASSQPPRQFINIGDFETMESLEDLSVKQLKEILMLNRIDFKGCCEKSELLERVQRLWQDMHNCPAVEKLSTDDLCKICMDAPIECVLLECGHMATCTGCGKVLSECPICRQYIVRVVRFFKA